MRNVPVSRGNESVGNRIRNKICVLYWAFRSFQKTTKKAARSQVKSKRPRVSVWPISRPSWENCSWLELPKSKRDELRLCEHSTSAHLNPARMSQRNRRRAVGSARECHELDSRISINLLPVDYSGNLRFSPPEPSTERRQV